MQADNEPNQITSRLSNTQNDIGESQEEEVAPLQIVKKSQQPNVIYMINQCLQQTASKNRVPSLIFSFLEIFELLRLKTTSTDFKLWVEEYFQHLEFLDLSPFFGYVSSEERILDLSYAHPRRSFFMVFQQLCPKRTNLSLAYSTQLTCSALKHFLLPDNWSEKLVGLNLYFCTKLKRVDLADVLCEYAVNLTDINLSMIHKLSICGLERILSSLPHLTRISIAGSLKAKQHSDEELQCLADIECSIAEKKYESLIFIDCRKCTLLADREFWMQANEQESKDRAMVGKKAENSLPPEVPVGIKRKKSKQVGQQFGVYQRGMTWILGPHDVQMKQMSQLLCLYSECGSANSKTAISCKVCQRKLFLASFLGKPSNLHLENIS